MLHPDDVYETRIVRPAVKNTGEEEIIAEDDQLFLMRLMRLQVRMQDMIVCGVFSG